MEEYRVGTWFNGIALWRVPVGTKKEPNSCIVAYKTKTTFTLLSNYDKEKDAEAIEDFRKMEVI